MGVHPLGRLPCWIVDAVESLVLPHNLWVILAE
jgi:hypothetical protein